MWTGSVASRAIRIAAIMLMLCALVAPLAFADLTPDQKAAEFQQLSAIYSKNYAPYEWKRDTQNFDLLHLIPWLERARATKDDLDFADLMVEYVSKLNDGHDVLTLRSTYFAYLGFDVDFYDGKPLIEFIDRALLPRTRFPFDIGDELISIDGFSPAELSERFWKYSICANDLATKRQSALWFTYRDQRFIPRAHELSNTARVVIRRSADGIQQTANITWFKSGTPMTSFGKLPRILATADPVTPSNASAAARQRVQQLSNLRAPRSMHRTVLGVGVRSPLFVMPAGFVQRLGRTGADAFFSGTYTANGLRIGYIRIPDFDPVVSSVAATQFTTEVAFMQANTDGLVIDILRNPGGLVGYTNFLISTLMPDYHRVLGFEIRATSAWVADYSQLLAESESLGDPPWVTALWRATFNDIRQANSENRGRTGSLALDSGPDFEPSLTRPPYQSRGQNAAYTKPILVLIDEFTASGGDAFAATMQDNKRALLFGTRTMGLGGSVYGWSLDGYAEVDLSVTASLMTRKDNVSTNGQYPVTTYIENVGVHPDIPHEFMTEANLRNGGRDYVDAFTRAITEHIRAGGVVR